MIPRTSYGLRRVLKPFRENNHPFRYGRVGGWEFKRLFGKSFRAVHGSFRPIDARFFGP